MKRYLLGKEKRKEIWRSISEGHHIVARIGKVDVAARIFGQEEEKAPIPTTLDLENIQEDNITISEMIFGIPPLLYEHIKRFDHVKVISDTL